MNPLICRRCGERAEAPEVIVPEAVTGVVPDVGTEAVTVAAPAALIACAACGHREPFTRLPLWSLTGPSGTGKSTVARLLVERLAGRFVVVEQDVLWQAGLRDPVRFRSAWLTMAAMIQQNGRPVLLCGTVAPAEFEPLPERALFDGIRYLALTCDPEVLAERLRRRPAWRGWSESRIAETLEFNAWVRAEADAMRPPMTLLDTTHATATATAEQVHAWLDGGRG